VLKLPKRKSGPGYQLDEEVELDYYRLQKISEGSISLAEGYAKPLDGPREVGSGMVREDPIALSRLIDLINERFGSELSEADQLFFDQIAEAASQNETLRKAAEVLSRQVPARFPSGVGIIVHQAHGIKRRTVRRLHEQAGDAGAGFPVARRPSVRSSWQFEGKHGSS